MRYPRVHEGEKKARRTSPKKNEGRGMKRVKRKERE